MRQVDVVVVGGGPAGSACAAALVRAGREVLVLDRSPFPRTKLCAGWVTPGVFDALGIAPAHYPHGLLAFDHLVIHARGMTFRLPSRQYSVRRFEFDDFLLRRSGAPVVTRDVREVAVNARDFILDGAIRARHVVGAGGTRCPVRRHLFSSRLPRDRSLQVAALELEYPLQWQDPRCHLWFFEHGLPGYGWYVPKAGGWLNIGIGARADPLLQRDQNLHDHWGRFTGMLRRRKLIDDRPLRPAGYSYYLRDHADVACVPNAYLAGDAAGMATRDLGEGIGPAIRSGMAVADSVRTGTPCVLDGIGDLSVDDVLQGGLWRTAGRPLVRSLLWKRSSSVPANS